MAKLQKCGENVDYCQNNSICQTNIQTGELNCLCQKHYEGIRCQYLNVHSLLSEIDLDRWRSMQDGQEKQMTMLRYSVQNVTNELKNLYLVNSLLVFGFCIAFVLWVVNQYFSKLKVANKTNKKWIRNQSNHHPTVLPSAKHLIPDDHSQNLAVSIIENDEFQNFSETNSDHLSKEVHALMKRHSNFNKIKEYPMKTNKIYKNAESLPVSFRGSGRFDGGFSSRNLFSKNGVSKKIVRCNSHHDLRLVVPKNIQKSLATQKNPVQCFHQKSNSTGLIKSTEYLLNRDYQRV